MLFFFNLDNAIEISAEIVLVCVLQRNGWVLFLSFWLLNVSLHYLWINIFVTLYLFLLSNFHGLSRRKWQASSGAKSHVALSLYFLLVFQEENGKHLWVLNHKLLDLCIFFSNENSNKTMLAYFDLNFLSHRVRL